MRIKTATMVYKSLNGFAPDYLKSIFTDRNAASVYSLRNCEGKIAVPPPPLPLPPAPISKAIMDNGAVMSNSSPTKLRQAKIIASFKSGCRGFLFDNK